MAKLTEAHLEQIRNMKADGKKYREIRDFFQQTYKIKLYDSTIAKTCRDNPHSFSKTKRRYSKEKKSGAALNCRYKTICSYFDICKPEICKFKGG